MGFKKQYRMKSSDSWVSVRILFSQPANVIWTYDFNAYAFPNFGNNYDAQLR